MNEVQVRERADRSTDELRAEWDAQSRRAVGLAADCLVSSPDFHC